MSYSTLDLEYDYDFFLVGIYCHYKDYRLAWTMNNYFKFNLEKTEDYKIVLKETQQLFSCYTYSLKDEEQYFYLLGNRSDNGFLVPEKKNIDYFLIVEGLVERNTKDQLVKNMKKLNGVLSAEIIDPMELRSKQNLLME